MIRIQLRDDWNDTNIGLQKCTIVFVQDSPSSSSESPDAADISLVAVAPITREKVNIFYLRWRQARSFEVNAWKSVSTISKLEFDTAEGVHVILMGQSSRIHYQLYRYKMFMFPCGCGNKWYFILFYIIIYFLGPLMLNQYILNGRIRFFKSFRFATS
jgi:hypothetical protein